MRSGGFRCEKPNGDLLGCDMPITATNPFKWRHYPGDISCGVCAGISATPSLWHRCGR